MADEQMTNEAAEDEQIRLSEKIFALAGPHRHEAKRFVKFLIVGSIGALIDFSVLYLLVELGWAKLFANIVSVSCAIISNFWWNRRWTFPESREHDLHVSFGKFATVNLIGLAINTVVFLTTDALVFGPLFNRPFDLGLAKATAIGVTLFWNFFANRRWTYRDI